MAIEKRKKQVTMALKKQIKRGGKVTIRKKQISWIRGQRSS